MPARRDNDRLKPAWDAWPGPHHPVYAMVVWANEHKPGGGGEGGGESGGNGGAEGGGGRGGGDGGGDAGGGGGDLGGGGKGDGELGGGADGGGQLTDIGKTRSAEVVSAVCAQVRPAGLQKQ